MSWDVIAFNSPLKITSLEDLTEDPPPLNQSKDSIINTILSLFPNAAFFGRKNGLIENEESSIEIDLGSEETVSAITFYLRGNLDSSCLMAIQTILKELNIRGFDVQTNKLISPQSLKEWEKYRNKIIETDEPSSPED